MRRRDVLAVLAGVGLHGPIAAFAQQAERIRVIGVLAGLAQGDPSHPPRIAAFEQGLRALGWSEGRNLRIHYRFAAGADTLPALAREMVELQPDVIVAGSGFVAQALLRETRTLPIVFVTAADPVGDGYAASLARPGGNATGFSNNLATMGGKWLELLKEIAPGIGRVGILFNPATAPASGAYFMPTLQAAAASLTMQTFAAQVGSPAEIEATLAGFGSGRRTGLVVMPDNFTSLHRKTIVAQAARNRLPAVYPFRYFATEGGLISYGADLLDLYRRVPSYVDRILRGAKPAELPVQTPTKIDLVVNLKTARDLGLTVPRIMMARADEVIE
jgi:putative ABC transport system substrate-binding protein